MNGMARTGNTPVGATDRVARGRRDAALVRVGKVTKSVAVAIVAAVGVLGLYVAKALPGHSAAPASQSTATTPPAAPTPGAAAPSGSSAPTNSPQTAQTSPVAPVSPPVVTRRSAQVTTGAS